VFDRAVFASRIHSLEDEQQRPTVLGIKHVLFFCEPLSAALKEVGCFAFVHLQAARVTSVEVLQLKALAAGNAERVGVVLDLVDDLFSRHNVTSLLRDNLELSAQRL